MPLLQLYAGAELTGGQRLKFGYRFDQPTPPMLKHVRGFAPTTELQAERLNTDYGGDQLDVNKVHATFANLLLWFLRNADKVMTDMWFSSHQKENKAKSMIMASPCD